MSTSAYNRPTSHTSKIKTLVKKVLLTNMLFIILFSLTSYSVSAQDKPINLGAKLLGVVSSAEYEQDNPLILNDIESNFGFGGGLQASVNIYGNFYVQPELLYVNKGHTLRSNTILMDTIPVPTTLSMNYIQLPILLAAKLSESPGLVVKFKVGPQFSYFLFGSKTQNPFIGEESTQSIKRGDVSSLDIGITSMLGFELPLESFTLTLDFRWESGVKNVDSRTKKGENWKHESNSVDLGIVF